MTDNERLFTIYDGLKRLAWQTSKGFILDNTRREYMSYHSDTIHVSIQSFIQEGTYEILSLVMAVELPIGIQTILVLDKNEPISMNRIEVMMGQLHGFIPVYKPKQTIDLEDYRDDSLFD